MIMPDIMGMIYGGMNAIFSPILAMDPNPTNPALTVLIFKLFSGVVSYECINNLVKITVENLLKLVKCKADSVVGYTSLRIVVGADSFTSVTCTDLTFSLVSYRRLLLSSFIFKKIEEGLISFRKNVFSLRSLAEQNQYLSL